MNNAINEPGLPAGYTARAGAPDDLQAITDLINRCAIREIGVATDTVERNRRVFETPGSDMANDTWVVFAPNGGLAGFGWVRSFGTHPLARIRPIERRWRCWKSRIMRWFASSTG